MNQRHSARTGCELFENLNATLPFKQVCLSHLQWVHLIITKHYSINYDFDLKFHTIVLEPTTITGGLKIAK